MYQLAFFLNIFFYKFLLEPSCNFFVKFFLSAKHKDELSILDPEGFSQLISPYPAERTLPNGNFFECPRQTTTSGNNSPIRMCQIVPNPLPMLLVSGAKVNKKKNCSYTPFISDAGCPKGRHLWMALEINQIERNLAETENTFISPSQQQQHDHVNEMRNVCFWYEKLATIRK